mmetsp:Transcript_42346/g.78910  ORF Transcript_42346/g.78910 Transcript_42346/m.78910 type:complete len:256 (-) Transcript_42346:85-852(-)
MAPLKEPSCPSVRSKMAETLFRCRLCSITCNPMSSPCAILVPPPAFIRIVAMVASSCPSRSMRRRRRFRSAPELKVTSERRSVGCASPMMKRTADFKSSILLHALMEPDTSRTHTISMGFLSAEACEVDVAACTVTNPKTVCAAPRGIAEYSTLVLSAKVPSCDTSGSGSACASGSRPRNSSSSSRKFSDVGARSNLPQARGCAVAFCCRLVVMPRRRRVGSLASWDPSRTVVAACVWISSGPCCNVCSAWRSTL